MGNSQFRRSLPLFGNIPAGVSQSSLFSWFCERFVENLYSLLESLVVKEWFCNGFFLGPHLPEV